MSELENQTEQPLEEETNEEEFFFEEEDSGDEDNQTANDISKNYGELQKTFTKVSQDRARLEKEKKELEKKAEKLAEFEKKEQENKRKSEIDEFQKKFEGLNESSIKAISDLQKGTEKSLEEIAGEYGFLQEIEVETASSGTPRGRSFVLPGKKEEYVIPEKFRSKYQIRSKGELEKIKRDFDL